MFWFPFFVICYFWPCYDRSSIDYALSRLLKEILVVGDLLKGSMELDEFFVLTSSVVKLYVFGWL